MVGSLKLSPDGKKLISGGRASGGGLFVWDAITGKRILWRPLGEEGELSRDGERLFVIESLPPPPPKAKGKLPADPAKTVKVSPLQTEVKNALKIYQLSTGKLLQQIDNPSRLHRFAVSPDERTLALEYAIPNVMAYPADFAANWFFKTRLELYDLKTGRLMHKLGELPQNYSGNGLVRFSADGKSLFAVSCSKENENRNESTVRRFDVATGALKSKTTINGTGYQMPRVYSTALKSASKTLIASGNTLWDLDNERLHWALKGNDLEAIVAFLADGRTAIGWTVHQKLLDEANPSTASKLVHWDLKADREIRRLPASLSFGAISPDGKTCYGADWPYNRWFRYDLASGKEIDAVDAPTAPPEQIAFSSDGKYVATTGRVWGIAATGKCVHLLAGARLPCYPFFHPGQQVARIHNHRFSQAEARRWSSIRTSHTEYGDLERVHPRIRGSCVGHEYLLLRVEPEPRWQGFGRAVPSVGLGERQVDRQAQARRGAKAMGNVRLFSGQQEARLLCSRELRSGLEHPGKKGCRRLAHW